MEMVTSVKTVAQVEKNRWMDGWMDGWMDR